MARGLGSSLMVTRQQQQHLGHEAIWREVRLALQAPSSSHSNAPQEAAECCQLLLWGVFLCQSSETKDRTMQRRI